LQALSLRSGGRAVHPIRWRKEYGGLNVDQAKRLKHLETENGRLKKLVADLSLEKQVLKDIAEENL
jgi:putative transposase